VTYCDHVSVDHDSPEPVYLQLAAILRQQIQDGVLVNRVPSVRTLAQEYGVSHITADKSLSVLKEEGLIRSVRGKGAYVNRLVNVLENVKHHVYQRAADAKQGNRRSDNPTSAFSSILAFLNMLSFMMFKFLIKLGNRFSQVSNLNRQLKNTSSAVII
jgi:GntR family transcriptional regulator